MPDITHHTDWQEALVDFQRIIDNFNKNYNLRLDVMERTYKAAASEGGDLVYMKKSIDNFQKWKEELIEFRDDLKRIRNATALQRDINKMFRDDIERLTNIVSAMLEPRGVKRFQQWRVSHDEDGIVARSDSAFMRSKLFPDIQRSGSVLHLFTGIRDGKRMRVR